MKNTARTIYTQLLEKNSNVFRRGESRNIMKLLEKYLGSSVEAAKAMEDIESKAGWFRKLVGKTGIQPFAADAESVVNKYIPGYIKDLQGMTSVQNAKNLKEHIKHLEGKLNRATEATAEKARELHKAQTPSKKTMIAAGLGGVGVGGLGIGGISAYLYDKKMKEAEQDKMRAAAHGLGIGMALPRVEEMNQMAYPDEGYLY